MDTRRGRLTGRAVRGRTIIEAPELPPQDFYYRITQLMTTSLIVTAIWILVTMGLLAYCTTVRTWKAYFFCGALLFLLGLFARLLLRSHLDDVASDPAVVEGRLDFVAFFGAVLAARCLWEGLTTRPTGKPRQAVSLVHSKP